MNARRKTVAGILAIALISGCQDKNQEQAVPEPSRDALLAERGTVPAPPVEGAGAGAANTPAAAVEADVPPISDVELITRKAEAHARRMTEEMQKPQAMGTAEIAGKAGVQPSVVDGLGAEGHSPDAAPENGGPASGEPAPVPVQSSAQALVAPVRAADVVVAGTANKAVSIEEPGAEATAEAVVSRPATAVTSEDRQEAESRLHAALAQALRDDPRDLSAHLDYQLLQFIQNKQAPDLAAVATLPEEDQEIVSAVLDALANFRHTVQSDSNPLLSRKVKPLMELGERLRARADLEVPTVQLCRRVEGYGMYEPIEGRLVAGQENQVIVYCEIENFMSQLNGQNLWETKVTEELVLYTENDGLPVRREEPVVVPDVCRNRRSDFFIVRKLVLPPTIPVGRYLLKVTVVDQLASRVAEATIPITFIAN